jgi:glycosyltransferase involved in cell wall biosynthesis
MRIVIAGLSAPTELNGVSRHAANIVRGLLSLPDAPEIHFVAGAWQNEMYARAIGSSHARLHIHSISIPHTNLARLRWYYEQLPGIAAELRSDLVHLSYTMPLRAQAFSCPTVVSLHDLYPFDLPQNFGLMKGPINRHLMYQCLRTVNAIACVSESTRGRLIRRFGARLNKKAVTIFNAIEPIPANSAVRPREIVGDEPFLLCIAQHRQNKNIPLAVRIFERLLRNRVLRQDARLLIVGIPGPATSQIHAQIRQSGLERSVVLLTGISDGELQWCYRNCKLLLAPSSIEGFGLPVAEALLAGCPVVCSDIPAFREIGADRCRYVRFGDRVLEDYEDAVRKTLAEPRRHAAVMPDFLPVVIAEKYMALYRKLHASRRTSSTGVLFYDAAAEELDPAEAG